MSRLTSFSVLILILVVAASANAQVCQDSLWPNGEFCGYDSAVVTSGVEMNHDCVNDFLDLILFSREMGSAGSNLSADLDGNGTVNIADAAMFAARFVPLGFVAPCSPSPAYPDYCAGDLALSLDPSSIVSRGRTTAPGLVTIYVVASGWTNAGAFEYTLNISPNATIISDTSPIGWLQSGAYGTGSYNWDGAAAPVSGTTVVVEHQVMVLDNQPAFIQLIDTSTARTRWAPPTLDARTEFQVRRHIGINGIDPVSDTACPAANNSPTVTITDPAGAISVPYSSANYTLVGTAADSDSPLALVEVRVNNGSWQLANDTAAWFLSVPLIVGENWIQVRAADTGGAYSQTEVVSIERLVQPDLSITQWISPPDTTLQHGCLELTVVLTVRNLSVAPSLATRVGYYLSDDASIDASDYFVDSYPVPAFGGGGSIGITLTLTIPDDGPRGSIYLGAFIDDLDLIDESNEANNTESIELEYEAPAIVSVVDVGNDQGRFVRVNALASSRDVPSATPVLQYEVFRRIDPLPITKTRRPAALVETAQISNPEKLAGWEYVGAVPAHGESEYNMIVPTLADSTPAGIYWSFFFVRAATANPWEFFDSCVDSGYSVDNLPPSVPAALMVAYAAAGNHLTWTANLEDDLRYYRVYRGPAPDFVPSEVNLAEATTTTDWLDTSADPWDHYYKITAVDHAGNESLVATPQHVTGDPDLPSTPTSFALHQCVPNPFNPVTRIEYDLPEDAFVTLAVYAANGHLVKTLVNDAVSRGVREAWWDGTDRTGRLVAAGVYLYRIKAGDYTETKRMVLMK
jgi:CARDB/FlgD Ig-like domain